MFTRNRHNRHAFNIWPGFVDALATVLMIIIFVLMTFVLSQLYLTDALHGKTEHVDTLQKKVEDLSTKVVNQKALNQTLAQKASTLDQLVKELNQRLTHLNSELSQKDAHLKTHTTHNQDLITEAKALKEQLNHLSKLMRVYDETAQHTGKKMGALNEQINATLIESLEDMKVLKAKIKTLEQQKDTLQAHTSELEKDYAVIAKEMDSNKALIQIGQYRSEFFSKLLKVLGSRKDIRIVGDRFIFQSEVLFDKASADLGAEGKERLDQLVKALMEIGKTIPPAMSWILRVDGHTDQLPIKNSNYPSNWELSAARSIAVVKYLVSKGIPESRLVAAGFGQHQPLIAGATEGELARNRRIEFKLDQR